MSKKEYKGIILFNALLFDKKTLIQGIKILKITKGLLNIDNMNF
jgi:hypothetical protein